MTTLSGTLTVGGNLVTGNLWLELSQQATAAGGVQVSPTTPSVFTLVNGAITGPGAGPYTVYGNDVLTPAATFYRLTVFDSAGQQLIRGNVSITGASQNIGAWATASTQSWVTPTGYAVSLIGDCNGSSTANTVTGIRGKSVSAPPWTPGHVLTVQADQSIAPSAPTGGGGTGGAPLTSQYLVGASDGTLLGERVVTNTGSVSWDLTVATEAKANAVFGAIAGTVCEGNDTRLSDPRTPTAHTHAQADVTNLVSDLSAKITTDGTARTIVKKAGSTIGTRRGVNFIEGANVTLTVADDAGNEEVDVTIAASGTTPPDADYGDITVSGTGATWTIDDNVVTYAKQQNVSAASRLLGRGSAGGAGDPEEITLGANISMTGTVLNVSTGTATPGDGDYGDITVSVTGTVWTIDGGTVTYAKMQDVSATDKVLGRSTAGSGDVEEISCTAAGRALLDDATAADQRTTLGLGSLATMSSIGTTELAANAVTDLKIRDSAGLSVIGRSANSTGDPADVIAANDYEVLRRSGTALGFGTVATGGIADAAVTYAKIQDTSAASRLLGRGSAGGAGDVEEISVGSGLSFSGTTLSASVGGAPTGAMVMWGTTSAPTDWLLCDGTAVDRTTYAALFAVIGTTFGVGNGSTTFNLPNFVSRFPLGKRASGTASTVGSTGGAFDHTHTVSSSGTSGIAYYGAGVTLAAGSDVEISDPFSMHQHDVSTSGTTSTNNPPYLVVVFIIKT